MFCPHGSQFYFVGNDWGATGSGTCSSWAYSNQLLWCTPSCWYIPSRNISTRNIPTTRSLPTTARASWVSSPTTSIPTISPRVLSPTSSRFCSSASASSSSCSSSGRCNSQRHHLSSRKDLDNGQDFNQYFNVTSFVSSSCIYTKNNNTLCVFLSVCFNFIYWLFV